MNTDKDALSYGQYLKAMRLEKRVRLEEISQETRIGMDILRRIEKEDDDALPAEVFVKGFLRAYSEVIGVDGEKAVHKYLAQRESVQEPLAPQKLYVQPRRRLWPLLLTALVILVGIVLASVYLSGDPVSPPPGETGLRPPADDSESAMPTPEPVPEESAPTESVEAVAEQPAEAAGDPPPPEPEAAPSEPAVAEAAPPAAADPEKLTLAVVAKEETWLKVIIDGGKPREYTLNAGDRLDFAGTANFNLLLGNAGGVDLFLNGTPVEVPGKSGQVLTLQLP